MPFDPEDFQDITGTDPGKGTKPSPGFDPSDVKAAVGTSPARRNLISGTLEPGTRFDDFRFQPKTNANNYQLRAQDQGFWESLGITAANLVPDIATDILQGVGYLGTLLEVGDDRDYNNALVKELETWKKPFGEVYTEDPSRTWDPSDSAWWFNNLGGLVESAASFAVEGAGIAKAFGTLAKAAAWSSRAAKVGSNLAQGLSAGTLSYMEGAMSGAQVFEQAYNQNYLKMIGSGIDPTDADQRAKKVASQAAAATVQIHMAMNIGLNLTGLTPLFREPEQAITRWWKTTGVRQAGESAEEWTARIAAAVPEGMPLKKLLGLGMQGPGRLSLEAFQEGLEEVNTQYAEHVGRAIGEGKEQKDVMASLKDMDRYFKEVLDQEGGLNFALGALGGVAQTALIDNIPVHKVVKYGPDGKPLLIDGTPQTERISSHTMNDRMNRQYFDNIRDALTKDVQWFSAKNKELEGALKSGDLAELARARADLLSVHNLRAISMGLGDVWKSQYEDIMKLDNIQSLGKQFDQPIREITGQMEEAFNSGDTQTANQLNQQRMKLLDQQQGLMDTTEAMQKGYAQDKNDNAYVRKAQMAIQNLDYLTDLYGKMQDRFSAPEYRESGVAEHMFYRQANLYLHKQQLDNMEQDLVKLRGQIDQMTLSSQDDVLVKQAQDFLADKEVLDTTVKKLNQDITRVGEAIRTKNESLFSKLLDKYKIPATLKAGKQLIDLLNKRKEELEQRIGFTSKELSDTVSVWEASNPGRKVTEVLKRASERPLLEEVYKQNKAQLWQGMIEYETARQQLSEDSKESSIRRFVQENKPSSTKNQIDKQHIEAYNQQLDREVAANLDQKQKEQLAGRLDSRITEIRQQIAEKQLALQELQRQRRNMTGFFKNRSLRKENQLQTEQLQSELSELRFELGNLQQRRSGLSVKVAQAAAQNQDVTRTPAEVTQSTDTTDLTRQPEQQEYAEELPFDFSTQIVPVFTTIEAGNPVLDNMMGSESAAAIREFIRAKKDSDTDWLVNAILTQMKKVNLPLPTDQEITRFLKPYVTALKQAYQSQTPDPARDYEAVRAMLKPDVLDILDILEGEFRTHGFSYDRVLQVLGQQAKEGKLDKNIIPLVANRMKAYMEHQEAPVAKQPETATSVQTATEQSLSDTQIEKEFNEQPGTYIPPAADTEPTTFSNAALELDNVNRELKVFVGASNIEGVKANFNTHPYLEFDNGSEIRIIADYTELDPNLNTDVLVPGVINAGDEVDLVVDEQWAGEINYDTEMIQDEYGEQIRRADMFQNYLDSEGKIAMNSTPSHPMGAYANVPIKIVHRGTGKTIGYFPRADWIRARYPDTGNYRNIVDEYRDGDTIVTDNVARQYSRVTKVREAVVRAWNTDNNLRLSSKIEARGTGHVMLNRETNNNTGRTKLVNRSAKNMLPDPSLEIAIIKQGSAYVSRGVQSSKTLSRLPGYMKSATSMPVALLPAPDGTHMPVPLYTHKLGDNPSSLNTIVFAVELYLKSASGLPLTPANRKTIDRLKEETEFDITQPEGLRNFIQQYFTYTQKFGEKDTVITPSEVGSGANPEFMLDIPDLLPGETIAFIKAGVSFSGEKPIYATLVNGSLHPDFEAALREGLQDRFKSVIFPGGNLRGINSQGTFKAPIIKKDGNLQINTYQDYNEFVKASSMTFAYGLHQVNGRYVYMANPVVRLDHTGILQQAPPAIQTSITEEQQPLQKGDEAADQTDDITELFGNGSLSSLTPAVSPVPVPQQGERVSLELLRELRNLTPEAHRNTKSPEQALEELLKRGVTVLADGHNPFYTC